MAKQKDPRDPNGPEGPQQEPEPEPPRHVPDGREHQVHQEILERRMRGGPAPTPEAYARALEQWKNLPGSVVRPATDVTPPAPPPPPEPPPGADAQGGKGPAQPDTEGGQEKLP